MDKNIEEETRNICEKIFNKYNEVNVKEAFEILIKLFNNIITKPKEEKFRTFKKSNETLKKKVLLISEIHTLLKLIGYVELDSEILAYQGDNIESLMSTVQVLNDYINVINSVQQEKAVQAELKKQEDIKRSNDEIARKYREEKEKQQKIKEQLENDKKERAKAEKARDSKANTMEFGAKVCKFEPKKDQRG